MAYQQDKVLKQWFPHLFEWMDAVDDPRKFHKYSTANLLLEGLYLFMNQERSRNELNNRAFYGSYYKENFSRMFKGMEWAHFDTVDNLLRMLDYEQVEGVKTKMIRSLIKNKRIKPFKKWGCYLIAIDATGVSSYDEKQREKLPHKKSKDGKVTYLNIMLEAKVVTPEGLSISLASEPLSNEDLAAYQKQDCELKAFGRITKKIKRLFPRLPVCLLLDGLYPNSTVFTICQNNGWAFIVNLKDGSLANLQQEVQDSAESGRLRFEQSVAVKQQKEVVYQTAYYQCIEGLKHNHHRVNWIESYYPHPRKHPACQKADLTRFTYLTNLNCQSERIIKEIVQAGRLRWKIENEGFNVQKNNGYHLHHKFSRYSVNTLHVYYILMQIAHLINQLVLHSRDLVLFRSKHPKLTIRYLWQKLRQLLEETLLCPERLQLNKDRCQIRFVYRTSRLE